MQLQGRNMKPNLSGADVRLLQFNLGLLGLEIPGEEAADNYFGEGTREAVQKLQKQFGLNADGIVVNVTTKRINTERVERISMIKSLKQLA